MIKKLLFILFFLPRIVFAQGFITNSAPPPAYTSRASVDATIGFIQNNTPSAGLDPDAVRFLDTAGITDIGVRQAISDYVVDGKANAWWALLKSKASLLYPCVTDITGNNTASLAQMKFNLINPAAGILTYHGTPTATTAGITFVPNTSWAQTGVLPATALSPGKDDNSFGYYSGSNVASPFQYVMGSSDFIGTVVNMYISCSTANGFGIGDQGSPDATFTPVSDSRGIWVATRTAASGAGALTVYRNGTSFNSSSAASLTGGLPNQNFYLGTYSNGGTGVSTGSTQTFETFFMAPGMNSTIAAAFSNATNVLQGKLDVIFGTTRKTY